MQEHWYCLQKNLWISISDLGAFAWTLNISTKHEFLFHVNFCVCRWQQVSANHI